jgi:hypothetical protein
MATQRKYNRRVIFGLMLAAMTPAAGAEILNCRPEIKYECRLQACERITEDFKHAEYFILDTAGKTLMACLWTACFVGQATVFQQESGLTAIGSLLRDGSDTEKRLISISMDDDRRFTAIWNHGSESTTLDMGICRTGP